MSNNDNHDAWWRLVSVCAVALAWGACAPDNTTIGSACKNGVCTGPLGSDAPLCLASSVITEIAFSDELPHDARGLTEVCWSRLLPRDEHGKVQCRVTWELRQEGAHCSDYPFLDSTPVSIGVLDRPTCLLAEIEAPSSGTGTEEGWFYASDVGKADCNDAIYFTPEVAHVIEPEESGVVVRLHCRSLDTVEADGAVVALDESLCTLPASAQRATGVGASCLPAIVPDEGRGGFSESYAYVETHAPDCQTGVCLVFHLQGDPTPSCSEDADNADAGAPCASQEDIDDRVYCSCRCDSYDGYHGCDCPHGYSCTLVANEGVAGGDEKYCAKSDTPAN